jgi:hypothetical protein
VIRPEALLLWRTRAVVGGRPSLTTKARSTAEQPFARPKRPRKLTSLDGSSHSRRACASRPGRRLPCRVPNCLVPGSRKHFPLHDNGAWLASSVKPQKRKQFSFLRLARGGLRKSCASAATSTGQGSPRGGTNSDGIKVHPSRARPRVLG